MHYRSTPLFLYILLVLSVGSVFAQKKATPFSTEEWGKEQRIKEMLDYWRSWELAGPDTNIEVARERGLQEFLSMPRPKSFGLSPQSIPAWELLAGAQGTGGASASGRTTDIAVDPRDPNSILYLATSGGGLWKTTNGSSPASVKWVPISNSFGSYAMGAVAVHPTEPDIVYAATGDLHDGDGDGLYKSTDAGLNWERIAAVGSKGISAKSNQLIINPLNPLTMYHTGNDGIRKSYDGGYTWTARSLSGLQHLVVDPTDTNRLYAGGAGKIVRSTDGGATWSGDMAANITGKGRITLGFSPKDSSKIYASISNSSGVSIGVGVSTDFGATWDVADYEDYMAVQGWYDNACAASPTKPSVVLVGGLDIYRSTTSGASLAKKTNWTANNGATNFTHADIHVLKYSPNGTKLYALTDGGIFVSGNDGNTWSSLNNDLGTLLFVGADVAPDMSYAVGGTQDNGTNRAVADLTYFDQTAGGDGGRSFIDQQSGSVVYSTHFGPDLFKSNGSGAESTWGANLLQGTQIDNEGTPFYMYYDVCESDGAYVALVGNSHIYYSEDGVNSITKITTSSIAPKSVHVANADPYYIYAGTGGGYVYTTPDAGTTWVKSTTRIGTAAGFVSDPNTAQKAWAVTAGFGGKKFWISEDGGKVWTSPATNLPDLNMKTIARAPNGDLFIGHEFGVMRSIDNGVTWEPLRDGLPLADVRKLRVRGDGKYLIAATYGRSMYKINIADLPRTIISSVDRSADPNFGIESVSPNPVMSGVEVRYKIASDSKVTIKLYDDLGREVRMLANEFNYAGEHTLRSNLGDLPSGSYSVVIAAGGRAITERLVITH